MSQSFNCDAVNPKLVNLVGVVSLAIATQIREAKETAAGQSASSPAALVLIHRYPEITVDVLGRYLQLSQSGAVRLVDRLTQQGWVQRNRGQDKRFVTLSLTEVGETVAIAILKERHQQIAQALTVLTPTEQQQLIQLLTKISKQQPDTGEQAEYMCRLCDMSICPLDACHDRWAELRNP